MLREKEILEIDRKRDLIERVKERDRERETDKRREREKRHISTEI